MWTQSSTEQRADELSDGAACVCCRRNRWETAQKHQNPAGMHARPGGFRGHQGDARTVHTSMTKKRAFCRQISVRKRLLHSCCFGTGLVLAMEAWHLVAARTGLENGAHVDGALFENCPRIIPVLEQVPVAGRAMVNPGAAWFADGQGAPGWRRVAGPPPEEQKPCSTAGMCRTARGGGSLGRPESASCADRILFKLASCVPRFGTGLVGPRAGEMRAAGMLPENSGCADGAMFKNGLRPTSVFAQSLPVRRTRGVLRETAMEPGPGHGGRRGRREDAGPHPGRTTSLFECGGFGRRTSANARVARP